MKNNDELKRLIIIITVGILVYCGINNLKIVINFLLKIIDVLFPFILGVVLAFILNIPMTKIENFLKKYKKNKASKISVRIIAIIISLVILFAIILFISFLLIPELIENIQLLISNIPSFIKNIEESILNLLKNVPEIQSRFKDVFQQNANIDTIIVKVLNYIVNGAVDFIGTVISSVITLFTGLVFAVYMLSQKEYLSNNIKKVMNAYLNRKQSKKILEIADLTNKTFSKFISGQCVEAAILGGIFFVVLTVFRFPYALIISVLTAITALIPIFGALIAMVIGAILIAVTSPTRAVVFIILFLVIQQIEGNFIYPKVVGKSVGLSPLLTLLAVTVGGSLFGVLGMLIGLPIASIIYALIKEDVKKRVKY